MWDRITLRRDARLVLALLALPVLLIGGVIGWIAHSATGDRAAIEKIVRETILDHPEILPQAMENLQQRESVKQLSGIRADLEKPFPGAVLGNPQGTLTMVEFTDFACGYCRQSVADVEELIRANPDLRVVIREFPILSPASVEAARFGLGAAEQGKYAAFHRLMFAAGRPDRAGITAAATAAGIDIARARKVAASPAAAAEIESNVGFARQLGFTGTPSWVIGDRVITGAVGLEELAAAIKAARG